MQNTMFDRMKRLVGLFGCLLLVITGLGQSTTPVNCQQAAQQYSEDYIAFLKGTKENVAILLFEWEQACGVTEPLFRARALQLLAEDNFPGMLHEKDMLDMALAFRTRYEIMQDEDSEQTEDYYTAFPEYFGHIPLNCKFDRQTHRYAKNLLSQFAPGTLEYAFLSLYSGEVSYLFELLSRQHWADIPLSREYEERVSFYSNKPEFNFGLASSLWIPGADLTVIGPKPALGIFVGVKKNQYYLNGVFEMRFGKTNEPFALHLRDTLVSTRNHQGGFLGVELGGIFWSLKGGKFSIGGGVTGGYDIIDIVEDTQTPVRQTFGSFSFRVGPV
ncbi:MAG: hypothetical protein ACOCXV_01915, partial [Bacteroidota bacterium]